MKRKTTTSLPRSSPKDANGGYLTGQLLIAMPQMQDARFHRSVLYICAHSSDGAMGLVINKVLDSLTVPELMAHLEVPTETEMSPEKIHFGGPVETARGFVLHSADYSDEGTIEVGNGMALTATLDILRAIGRGEGPRRTLLALGYAGWGPGQLDAEIQANGWLNVSADENIVFDDECKDKWQRALGKLGIEPIALSGDAGHA
jgi:putative transcriptional regulator